MAQPALHFAVGATCGTILSLVIPPVRRRWHRFGPLITTLAGVWACLPDVDHLRSAAAIHHSHWEPVHGHPVLVNFFFFHGFLDQYFPGQGTIVGMAWLVLLYTAFFVILAHRIYVLESRRDPGAKGLSP